MLAGKPKKLLLKKLRLKQQPRLKHQKPKKKKVNTVLRIDNRLRGREPLFGRIHITAAVFMRSSGRGAVQLIIFQILPTAESYFLPAETSCFPIKWVSTYGKTCYLLFLDMIVFLFTKQGLQESEFLIKVQEIDYFRHTLCQWGRFVLVWYFRRTQLVLPDVLSE